MHPILTILEKHQVNINTYNFGSITDDSLFSETHQWHTPIFTH